MDTESAIVKPDWQARTAFDPLHQLPPPPLLIGRDGELAELETRLAAGDARGAVIFGRYTGLQGMGGVGKTALAVSLAWRLEPRFPDAQLLVSLHGEDPNGRFPLTAATVMQTVIHSFHPELPLPEELDALEPIFVSTLQNRGRRCLLLLDDAAGMEQIQPLLPPSNCLLLVTARRPIHLPGLMDHKMDCLPRAASVELLGKLAPAMTSRASHAAQLCGDLPLALKVFAGAVGRPGDLSLSETMSRLKSHEEKLAPADAALAVTSELLNPALRRRWFLLSVFPASFDLDAVRAVWDGSGERENTPAPSESEKLTPFSPFTDEYRTALQGLVEGGLVEWNAANRRFHLHPLARDFALGRMAPEDLETARLSHAEHFTRVGQRARDLYRAGGSEALEGLALFDREWPHLEAAFDYLWPLSSRTQNPGRRVADLNAACRRLVALVNAAAPFGKLRWYRADRIRWHEPLRAAARELGDTGSEALALDNLGFAYAAMGKARYAIECFDQFIDLARELDDREGERNALWNSARCLDKLGQRKEAIARAREALALYAQIDAAQAGVVRAQLAEWNGEPPPAPPAAH